MVEDTIFSDIGEIIFLKSNKVYQPSDDTLLIIKSMKAIKSRGYSFNKIIEIGSGTGILSLAANKLFSPTILVSVDISPFAVKNTYLNLNNKALVIRCDGSNCVKPYFDLAIINPPYLPSHDKLNKNDYWLIKSWEEKNNHRKMCLSSIAAKSIIILKSSLSKFNQDKCLKKLGFNKKETVSTMPLFMEKIEVNYWIK
ncbi:MAG: methyltransferase [Caldisphaera sp.]|jgi:release factor glutamine methyltransferase|nr:methyltransferase [Caldisphaera sp.]PMP61025.1 MAG: hypothetical protein C0201_00930 [Caldisphaera sp.]PMP88545.1 MAG: hypothetical protein C0172_02460 [Caldisphaera sp.]